MEHSTPSGETGAFTGEYIAIATVGKPVGLEGWCRLIPFGETLKRVMVPCKVMTGIETPENCVELVELRKVPKGHQARFLGYDDRDSVDSLKHRRLFIKENQLPGIAENEYYHFELENMAVYGQRSQEYIGSVITVHNYPTVDALEIRKKSGFTFIVPLTKEIVLSVDTAEKKIIVADAALEELL